MGVILGDTFEAHVEETDMTWLKNQALRQIRLAIAALDAGRSQDAELFISTLRARLAVHGKRLADVFGPL